MKFREFEKVISVARMSKYLIANHNNKQKTLILYRYNLQLTQNMLTTISCFEIALRNKIDEKCLLEIGNDWLLKSATSGGIFDSVNCRETYDNINNAKNKLGIKYSHNKLVAELGFGFWRYMFARNQYNATGRILLSIFINRPKSTPNTQYNANYIFGQLEGINKLRNRVAHHEPLCFDGFSKNTTILRREYNAISQLFQWMGIDLKDFLNGLDRVEEICNKIDTL